MRQGKKKVYLMTYGAAIAAVYVVLTMIFAPISFGPIQFRVSEVLCILPAFTPAAVPGLFLGCFLSNCLCGAVAVDVVFGSLATLVGAFGSWKLRAHRWCVCIPPILSNMLVIPWVLRYAYGAKDLILYLAWTVGLGEVMAVGVLGNLLMLMLERYKKVIFREVN